MTSSPFHSEDELKKFLQQYQPRPEPVTDPAQLNRIRARLETSRTDRRLVPARWLAATSALAAGVIALVMTIQSNRLESGRPHGTPAPIKAELEADDLYSEVLPAHDIGETYFELVAEAAKP
jgi:hypothetical protein